MLRGLPRLVRVWVCALILLLAACADPGAPPAPADAAVDAPSDLAVAEDVPPLSEDEDVSCGVIYVSGDDDTVEDAGAPCVPGRAEPCSCATGGAGIRTCGSRGRLGVCWCLEHPTVTPPTDPDAGIVVYPDAATALPPRLLRPLSGMRVYSQRPALRWVLPAGLSRARVELCDDRACTRPFAQVEVTGTEWRPPSPLRPGVAFWRVQGLRDDGAVAWTSATWEFGVRRRDTPTDTIGGPLKDFDGDGYDDAVLGGGNVLLLRGGPGGARRRPEPILVSTSPYDPSTGLDGILGSAMGVGDFNGDGLADVALSHSDYVPVPPQGPQDYINVFQGSRECPLRAAGVLRMPAYGVDWGVGRGLAVDDFNGDGFADVISAGVNVLSLYPGGPSGVSRLPTSHIRVSGSGSFGYRESTRGLGDVDGDGYADIAVGNFGMSGGDGQVQVFYGNPAGRLEARVQTIPSSEGGEFGRFVMGGDYDGDGYSDLLATDYGYVYWFRGTPRGVVFLTRSQGMQHPDPQTPGDLDGDGLVEVFVHNGTTIHRGRSAAEFVLGPEVDFIVPLAALFFSPGDMDSDGQDDLILTRQRGWQGDMAYLFRGGSLRFNQPALIWQLSGPGFHRAE